MSQEQSFTGFYSVELGHTVVRAPGHTPESATKASISFRDSNLIDWGYRSTDEPLVIGEIHAHHRTAAAWLPEVQVLEVRVNQPLVPPTGPVRRDEEDEKHRQSIRAGLRESVLAVTPDRFHTAFELAGLTLDQMVDVFDREVARAATVVADEASVFSEWVQINALVASFSDH